VLRPSCTPGDKTCCFIPICIGVIALRLDVLPRPKSVELLREFRPDLPANDPDLVALADTLGDLPLATSGR
jgi:hypothetical protein